MPPAIRAKTRTRRGQMPNGGSAFTGRASIPEPLKKRILEIDNQLEIHAYPDGRDHMYRVKVYGGAPSEDELVHQFELKYPAGEWLIECLNECDQWKKYRSVERSVSKRLEKYIDRSEVHEREARLRVSEVSEALAPEIIAKIERRRVAVSLGTVGPASIRR